MPRMMSLKDARRDRPLPAPGMPASPLSPALAEAQELLEALIDALLRRGTVKPGELLEALAGSSGPAALRLLHQVAAHGVVGDVHAARLEVASRLLRHTRLTVGQVARVAGYRSTASFRAAFRRARKMAPSRFRALHTVSGHR